MQFLAAADEHHVLGAVADQVRAGTDAMCRGRAGGRDRIAQAEDAKRSGQGCRDRRAHRPRHHVRADATHALLVQQFGRLDLPLRRTAAGAGNHAAADVAYLLLAEAGVGDCRAHGDIGIGGRITHEALELAIDGCFQVDMRNPGHATAQPELGIFGHMANAADGLAQGGRNRFEGIAKAGHQAHAGHYDTTHLRIRPLTGRGRRASRRRHRFHDHRRRCGHRQ